MLQVNVDVSGMPRPRSAKFGIISWRYTRAAQNGPLSFTRLVSDVYFNGGLLPFFRVVKRIHQNANDCGHCMRQLPFTCICDAKCAALMLTTPQLWHSTRVAAPYMSQLHRQENRSVC
jgi:hypothetical protein